MTSPQVYGAPGGSLDSAGFDAGRVAAGKTGEVKTAALLAATFAGCGDVAIFHDLAVPGEGTVANVDHLVLRGRRAIVVDSKFWKAGFYWGTPGSTLGIRRGFARFEPAEKRLVGFAVDRWQSTFDSVTGTNPNRRIHVSGLIVVWPSTEDGKVRLWAARAADKVLFRSADRAETTLRHLAGRPGDVPGNALEAAHRRLLTGR